MMKYFKYAVLSLVLVVSVSSVVIAQGLVDSSQNALVDTESNVETVTYYGQTFIPMSSEEGFYQTEYTWKDMKSYVEPLLPEATTTKKTPEALCEHLTSLERLYMMNYEKALDNISKHYADILKGETDLQVAQMLQLKSGLVDLIELKPQLEGKVVMAQTAHNQYLGMMMLADGARAKFCPPQEPNLDSPFAPKQDATDIEKN